MAIHLFERYRDRASAIVSSELGWDPSSTLVGSLKQDQKRPELYYLRTSVKHCPNKGSEHGNNTLYLQFNSKTNTVKLRCHSPHSYDGVPCSQAKMGKWSLTPQRTAVEVLDLLAKRPRRWDWDQLAARQEQQLLRGEAVYEADEDDPHENGTPMAGTIMLTYKYN